MDAQTLFTSTGLLCVISAIVGGGLNAFGIVMPGLASRKRQLVLGIFGIILLAIPYAPTAVLTSVGIGPQGHIDLPVKSQKVEKVFDCKGSATNIPKNMHLWLVEEIDGLMWPKDVPSADGLALDHGTWKATIYEQGTPKTFAISLLIANSAASSTIHYWLENGKATGQYPPLRGIPGATPIATVTGLRLD